MALKIKVTLPGRAALVNAANTGTLPVLVAQIGVTSTAFTPAADGSDLVLPGELKRLVTFGGAAVADDTIHSVIRDNSTETYTWRGFGLYLADGTLFALYGQADPILEKSAGAMAMLATDIIFADIDAAALTFGDTSFLNPPATVDVQGVVELATDAEALAGADATRALTPKNLLAVLTARLGAGNPSTFVKTLLDKVSALAFVTALGIRGAASFDTGTGNGLDADLLDGQHGSYYRAWANLTGVPVQFPPMAHDHAWVDLFGVPATASRWPAWDEVTSKPAAFTPLPHSHAWANINDPPDTATRWPSVAEVTGLQSALDAKAPLASPQFNGDIELGPGDVKKRVTIGPAGGNELIFDHADGYSVGSMSWRFAGVTRMTLDRAGNLDVVGVISASSFNAVGYDVPDTSAARARAPRIQGGGGVGAGGTLLFGVGSANFAYIKGYFTNGSVNGTGKLVIGTRTSAADASMTSKVIINDNGDISISPGSLTVGGAVSCLTINATGSDIRLKTGVQTVDPRPLHRLLAALPDTHGALTTYIHRVDGKHRLGPIAQDMERVEPAYMGTIEIEAGQVKGIAAGTYKTVDKSSAAYEQAMWAGQEIDRLHGIIVALQSRLAALELR